MIVHNLEVEAAALADTTGWVIKPQGACKDERCVPLPPEVTTAGGRLDLKILAQRLGMPLIPGGEDLWSLGPEAGGKALTSAQAPDFSLPDLEGRPFRLSSLRGRKVLLVAWASW